MRPAALVSHATLLTCARPSSNVLIKGNKVVESTNGLRIKTQQEATGASVSNVVYDGNTVTGATDYGVVIQQGASSSLARGTPQALTPRASPPLADYDNKGASGTAGNGVAISSISFTGAATTVTAGSKAQAVKILCVDPFRLSKTSQADSSVSQLRLHLVQGPVELVEPQGSALTL